jgi:hypothetical protein
MPHVFGGDSVEEQQLAKLLSQVLDDLKMSRRRLAQTLRPDQFDKGRRPSQATVYRYLDGDHLMAKGEELIDAVLELCTPERRRELKKEIKRLFEAHRAGPTPIPPHGLDDRIATLEAELDRAQRDKEVVRRERDAALQAADEEIATIQHLLVEEQSRRASAEHMVGRLQPVDPERAGKELAQQVLAMHGQDEDRLDDLLGELAGDDLSAPILAATLHHLERVNGALSVRLATRIGSRRYYKLIPELARILNWGSATEAWAALLQTVGVRFRDDQRDWLVANMPALDFGGSVVQMLSGIAGGGDCRDWLAGLRIAGAQNLPSRFFFAETVDMRPPEKLFELVDELRSEYPDDARARLVEAIGASGTPELVVAAVDRYRGDRHDGRDTAEIVWKAAARERRPEAVIDLTAHLRRLDRGAEADALLRRMATELSLDHGLAAHVAAQRHVGQDADADQIIHTVARKADPYQFVRTLKDLRKIQREDDANLLLAAAARRWWVRRWKLAEELRGEDLAGDVGAIKARMVVHLRQAATAVVLAAFMLVFAVGCLTLTTPLGARSDVEAVVSGDAPVRCTVGACPTYVTRLAFTYVIDPGGSVETVYRITAKLHHLRADLRLAVPVTCPARESFATYAVTAGGRSTSGRVLADGPRTVRLDTGGASTLTLRARGAGNCRVTLTVVDPAMNRHAQSWLQKPL